MRNRCWCLAALVLVCVSPGLAQTEEEPGAVEQIQKDAKSLEPLVTSPLAREFLSKTSGLPEIKTRTLLRDTDKTNYYTEEEAKKLPEEQQESLETKEYDAAFYYNTRYGSPLAYSRPLDLVAANGLTSLKDMKVFDFGYGTIGHLKLMAAMGAEVVGVEVDSRLRALYSWPEDQRDVTLIDGHFPGDDSVKKETGDGYDLFISKNVLKNGYIHPERPVDPERLVHLQVSDEVFVAAVGGMLKPGGLAIIYNLHPAQAPPDQPYIPWADGRCPFAPEIWKAAGFEVVTFDADDGPAARAMAKALGWDQGGMNVDTDLFATYTIARKLPAQSN